MAPSPALAGGSVLPEIGELTVSYATFRPTTDPDQVLCTYTAEPGSATARLLRVIAGEPRAEAGRGPSS
ncbi:hypothetical protein ACFWWB_19255 [Streptomyces sp. NPDC058690]|uniref:MmyB family transcriptional regulator n=1 Tax=Streptomyces sp. NPDC058690 TaxID=3346600 RepID=UPI00364FFA30